MRPSGWGKSHGCKEVTFSTGYQGGVKVGVGYQVRLGGDRNKGSGVHKSDTKALC